MTAISYAQKIPSASACSIDAANATHCSVAVDGSLLSNQNIKRGRSKAKTVPVTGDCIVSALLSCGCRGVCARPGVDRLEGCQWYGAR